TPRVLTNLEAWIRRRLRLYLWRQWQNGHNRFNELRRRGVPRINAAVAAGPVSLSRLNAVQPPWYVTRMPGGVGGVAPRGVPLSRSTGNFLQPKYPDKRRNRERTGKRRRIVNASVASSRSRQRQ